MVVGRARELLDEQGADGFSMVRLAEELGVTTMALYRHVTDRGDLERAVVELVLGELASPAPTPDNWEACVADWMHAVRQCWIAHPWVGGMLGSRTELSPPWLAAVDRLTAILMGASLSPTAVAREAVHISRTTVGVLLLEVSAPLPHNHMAEAAITHLPESAWARWQSIAAALSEYGNDELFHDFVRTTLVRLSKECG
jgi:AcrR family transcriptional regulator